VDVQTSAAVQIVEKNRASSGALGPVNGVGYCIKAGGTAQISVQRVPFMP
jgi:hypothetical protein